MLIFLLAVGALTITLYAITYAVCLTHNKWGLWAVITLLIGFAMFKTLPSYVGDSTVMSAGLISYGVLSLILILNWSRKLAVIYDKPKALRVGLVVIMLALAFGMIYSGIVSVLFDAFVSIPVYLIF